MGVGVAPLLCNSNHVYLGEAAPCKSPTTSADSATPRGLAGLIIIYVYFLFFSFVAFSSFHPDFIREDKLFSPQLAVEVWQGPLCGFPSDVKYLPDFY